MFFYLIEWAASVVLMAKKKGSTLSLFSTIHRQRASDAVLPSKLMLLRTSYTLSRAASRTDIHLQFLTGWQFSLVSKTQDIKNTTQASGQYLGIFLVCIYRYALKRKQANEQAAIAIYLFHY